MRISCNGCRVLRKGCSDDCTLRPCLDWIKTPESQANATLFLAKFYGRAGLFNLINAGPSHLRPAIFRSLLYEACGRIVNPVYGSVGLLWSNNWDTCQSAVEAVLSGSPISQQDATHPIMPLEGCDIRHLTKDPTRVTHCQTLVKRKSKVKPEPVPEFEPNYPTRFTISGWEEMNATQSQDSSSLLFKPEETVEEREIGLELSLGLNLL